MGNPDRGSRKDDRNKAGEYFAMGLSLGLLWGAVWHNLALGLALGVVFGSMFHVKRGKKR